LATLVVLYAVRTVVQYRRIRHFPGPWKTAFSTIPHNVKAYTGEAHNWYRDVSDKYGRFCVFLSTQQCTLTSSTGPIARVGPTSLITSSADVWLHVNTKPGYTRSKWYFEAVRVEHQRDHVFSQTDTKLHDERRKQIAPGVRHPFRSTLPPSLMNPNSPLPQYSGRENPTLEPTIDATLTTFLTLIRTKYLSHPSSGTIIPMDLAKKTQFFTLDVISALGTGRAFGMLAADADIDAYIRSADEGMRAANAAAALGLAWLTQAPVIGRWIAPAPTDKSGFGKMMGACFGVVDERVRELKKVGGEGGKRDMLASFVQHGLEGDALKSEVLETLIAGSDTTAGAIRGVMLYLMGNKRVYVRLQAEVDEAVREGKVGGEGEGIVPYAVAKQLPYLQAVIREGLRVWPPVRNILPKDVPAGGDTVMVDGKPVFLPEGVDIGFSALAMHRDKKVYGEDADLFRPERWFEPDADKLAAMMRVSELTFGHGRWQCLGKNVAQMELNKTFFEVSVLRCCHL
jgi:cytochrome P450